MKVERDLPPYEQSDRQYQKAPCVCLADEEQRCEHHRKVPVIDAASAAAFVLQEPRLERAEEHNAYHIAHRIRSAKQYHDAVIEYAHHVQHPEYAVEYYPYEYHQHGSVVVVHYNIRLAGLYVIARELLLAARAFDLRREEAEYHLDDIYHPYKYDDPGHLLKSDNERLMVNEPVPDI